MQCFKVICSLLIAVVLNIMRFVNLQLNYLKKYTFNIDSLPFKLAALTYGIITQIKPTTYDSIKSAGQRDQKHYF